MTMLRRALGCLALLLLAGIGGIGGISALGANTASTEDFAIQLHAPVAVGQRTRVSGTSRSVMTMTVTVNGKDAQQEKNDSYHFAVTVEVLAVGKKQNVTEAMLTIHELTKETGGAATPLLAAGELVVERIEKGETIFEVRGHRLPKEVSQPLGHAFRVRSDDVPRDEEALGTQKRRHLGETWSIDPELLTQVIIGQDRDLVFKAKDLTGTVKLAGKKLLGDVPCFELQVEAEIRNPTLSMAEPVPGLTATMPSIKTTVSQLLPVDASARVGETTSRSEGAMLLSGEIKGTPITGRALIRSEVFTRESPLPGKPSATPTDGAPAPAPPPAVVSLPGSKRLASTVASRCR
jgi:hypothetical protein